MGSKFASFCVVLIAFFVGISTSFAEGKLAQLYAEKPPEESAFVRVISTLPGKHVVEINRGPSHELNLSAKPASPYAVVRGEDNFSIVVDGAGVGEFSIPEAKYFTAVVMPSDDGKPAVVLIDDGNTVNDSMKAVLHFYNLLPGCSDGALAIEKSGAQIFSGIDELTTMQREINPVRATLMARCGDRTSESVDLPTLHPGDHYNLFLLPGSDGIALQGQLSQLE